MTMKTSCPREEVVTSNDSTIEDRVGACIGSWNPSQNKAEANRESQARMEKLASVVKVAEIRSLRGCAFSMRFLRVSALIHSLCCLLFLLLFLLLNIDHTSETLQ